MNTKDRIFEIINNPALGAVQLVLEFYKLNEYGSQNEFLNALKEVLKDASDKEKAVCYTTIDMLNKVCKFEERIKQDIEDIEMTQSQSYINSLLWLASALSNKWSFSFIQKVINHFKPRSGEYSYLYSMGVRSLVSTKEWRVAIDEIFWVLENFSDDQIVDLFAYFKWKQGDVELDRLFQAIKDNDSLNEKINSLKLKINDRYINNYDKLNQ